jgi:hypothetical protein
VAAPLTFVQGNPNSSRSRESKPGQANPNRIAWISLVSFVRIRTYQWVTAIPNRNFSSRPSPYRPARLARRASPGAPSFSDYCEDVGRLPIFARWESKNCWRILNPAWSSGRRFGRARAGRQTKSISQGKCGALRALTGREHLNPSPRRELRHSWGSAGARDSSPGAGSSPVSQAKPSQTGKRPPVRLSESGSARPAVRPFAIWKYPFHFLEGWARA